MKEFNNPRCPLPPGTPTCVPPYAAASVWATGPQFRVEAARKTRSFRPTSRAIAPTSAWGSMGDRQWGSASCSAGRGTRWMTARRAVCSGNCKKYSAFADLMRRRRFPSKLSYSTGSQRPIRSSALSSSIATLSTRTAL